MRYLLALAFFLAPLGAYAQQSTPREQALSNRLVSEINNNLQCSTDVLSLQQQIAKLQQELKDKEPKKEEKAPAKKP